MTTDRIPSQWVLVRSPGHWVHCGILEHRDASEIRLRSAVNILRWRDGQGVAGLLAGPGPERVAQYVGTLVITNGAGVIVYEDATPWVL